MWYFSGEMFAKNYFHGRMLLALYMENVDGVRILIKATVFYARYRTILYYITIQYIFCFLFFLVLYHTHTQHVGGMYVMLVY